jgi:hypothetical protein
MICIYIYRCILDVLTRQQRQQAVRGAAFSHIAACDAVCAHENREPNSKAAVACGESQQEDQPARPLPSELVHACAPPHTE